VILVKIPSENRDPSTNDKSAGVGNGVLRSNGGRLVSDEGAVAVADVEDDPAGVDEEEEEEKLFSWS
jgi:hypothetical protein